MSSETWILLLSTLSVAFIHTAAGPDHYLPFIVLSKARNWSFAKTLRWTMICGLGHIGSSVLLALGVAALGWSLSSLQWLEGVRGSLAGWALLVFGMLYAAWGLYRLFSNRAHKHFDMQENGDLYVFEHQHGASPTTTQKFKVTPWVMFIIFLLGPCEPMIPLLYFPALKNNGMLMVTLIVLYTIVTLFTMLLMVTIGYKGYRFFKLEKAEKYMHLVAGFTILLCGAGMLFFGW